MEAPITRTCSRWLIAASLAALSAFPAAARPVKFVVTDGRLMNFVKARTADAIGDRQQAARLYAGLAASDRKDSALQRKAISAAIGAGAFDSAIATARAVSVDSLALDARLLLVADALRRDRTDEALGLINETTRERDGGFVVPLLRAWFEQSAGRDGQKYLTNSAASQSLLAPFLAEQRAYLFLQAKDVAQARPLIDEALARAGGRAAPLRLVFAEGLRNAGDAAGAAALVKDLPRSMATVDARAAAALRVDSPADAFAQLMGGIAIALNDSNDRSTPIALTQVARAAAPARSANALLTALLLDSDDHHGEALALLATISDSDPLAGEARDNQVRILGTLDRDGEAVRVARDLLARLGNRAEADDQARLGAALEAAGNHGEAAAAFGRAIALADAAAAGNRWTYRLFRASQLDEAGRWPEARAELEAALRVKPDEPLLLNYLGYGQLERGEDLDRAEAMIRKASALKPDDASITDSLGWALYKRGRSAEAIETLQRAANADPAQSEISEHLGDALYSVGRRNEARFAWRAALVQAEGKQKARVEQKIELGLTSVTAAP